MKELDEIDKVFKSQLYDRESQLDPNALIAAMDLLEQHDQEIIAAKRKSRFLWIMVACLAFLFSFILFIFNQTEDDPTSRNFTPEKTIFENDQERESTLTKDTESAKFPSNADQIEPASDPQLPKTTSAIESSNPQRRNEPTHESNTIKSTQPSSSKVKKETHSSIANAVTPEIATKESSSTSVDVNQSPAIEDSDMADEIHSDNEVLNDVNESISILNSASKHDTSGQIIEPNNQMPVESNATFEESTDVTIESDSLTTSSESLLISSDSSLVTQPGSGLIYPPTPGHKLVLFGGISGYQISSKFRDQGNELGDYITQRNNQESAIQTWGADFGLMHLMNRSSLRFGLGFYASGENIQYQGMKTTTTYDTTSYWEHSNLWLQIIDATPIDGIYVFDTTYISVNADSTLNTEISSNTEIINNADLQRNNGKTKMYHVTIPITYSFNVIQSKSLNVALLAGVEADYRISNNARYLATNRENTTSLPSFDGYRKFMLNGSAGVELQYGSAMSKVGFTAGVGMKRNLYSWNKNFSHIYSSPWVRLGVVFRL